MDYNVIVGNETSGPDLKIYNVLIYFNHVEEITTSPMIFKHDEGFDTPLEALNSLHQSFKELVKNTLGEEYDEEEEYWDMINYITDFYKAPSLSDAEDGHGAWAFLLDRGWSLTGRLVTGLCLTILEDGEKLLADKKEIKMHVDLFEKKIKPKDVGWKTSSLRLEIITVSEIS